FASFGIIYNLLEFGIKIYANTLLSPRHMERLLASWHLVSQSRVRKHQNKDVNKDVNNEAFPYYYTIRTDSMPTNVVGDPTDPKGTLRLNLHLEIGTGDYYESLFYPEFD